MKKQYQYIPIEISTHKILKELCVELDTTFDSLLLHKCFGVPLESRKPFGGATYPFHSLEVGESVAMPWPALTELGAMKEHGRMAAAVKKYGKRTGRKFHLLGNHDHLLVTRMPDDTRGNPLYPPPASPP